jgi:hypothetical protein
MAIYANLTVDQGSDFTSTVSVVDALNAPLDLTGYTFRGQVRKTYTSSTAVDFTLISNAPSTGDILLSLSSAQTAEMKAGRYHYDVEIVSAGNTVTRVLEGQLEVTPRATRVV